MSGHVKEGVRFEGVGLYLMIEAVVAEVRVLPDVFRPLAARGRSIFAVYIIVGRSIQRVSSAILEPEGAFSPVGNGVLVAWAAGWVLWAEQWVLSAKSALRRAAQR